MYACMYNHACVHEYMYVVACMHVCMNVFAWSLYNQTCVKYCPIGTIKAGHLRQDEHLIQVNFCGICSERNLNTCLLKAGGCLTEVTTNTGFTMYCIRNKYCVSSIYIKACILLYKTSSH